MYFQCDVKLNICDRADCTPVAGKNCAARPIILNRIMNASFFFVTGADALALTCLLAVLYRKQNLVFPEHGGSFLVVTDLPKLYGG